jgi:hypothetical protein
VEAAKVEFAQQSTLVHFFEESGAQGVGHLEDSAEHSLCQHVQKSALIGVHRRPQSSAIFTPGFSEFHNWPLMNTDQRRFFGPSRRLLVIS